MGYHASPTIRYSKQAGVTVALYAFTRCKTVRTMRGLINASRHAARLDASAERRMRPDANPARRAIAWRPVYAPGDPPTRPNWAAVPTLQPGDPKPRAVDYPAAFRERKAMTGARERKNSAPALHVLCGVSRQWLQETGDPHDPIRNPRVMQLASAAVRWGEAAFGGPGAVIGARLDLDEFGAAVVDLFVSPVANIAFGRSRDPRPTISVRSALAGLSEKHGMSARQSFGAVATDWAEFAKQHLDDRLERGKPAAETGRAHIPPDEYRAEMERLDREKREAERELERVRALSSAALADADAKLADLEDALTVAQDDADAWQEFQRRRAKRRDGIVIEP